MNPTQDSDLIRSQVREHYGKIAEDFSSSTAASCGCCADSSSSVERLYQIQDAVELPQDITGLSLGCGDPITLASLKPGQTVLDLGSGGGIDCFLAARQVGPSGHVIGVDMTASMLEKARANQKKMGLANVEFRLGEIEHLPVADASVDVIISNCVINLSPDKNQVLREAFRVLKPGGRLAVSDIATEGPLPESVRNSLSAWAGCVAGALDVGDYRAMLEAVGFEQVEIARDFFSGEMVDQAIEDLGDTLRPEERNPVLVQQTVFSARITGYKPET